MAAKLRARGLVLNVELLHVPFGTGQLAALYYEPRRARGVTIVAGHGYSSSKHNLDFLCAFLAGHGYAVYSLDFPGHKLGGSGGRLNSDAELVAAMHAVVTRAREHTNDTIYTMGHSMGAQVALRTAAADPQIAGAIAIATGYGRPTALAQLQGKVTSDFRSSYVDGLTLPELVRHFDDALDDALPKLAGRPLLVVAADRDMMVNAASVRELFDRAPEPKTLVSIQSDHTNAADNSRSAVLQWLNARHPERSAQ
jgi:pimeloyl-ACP methyl ester carboxylesterase